MNKTMNRIMFVVLAVCVVWLTGCKTDQPGVTNRAGTIKAALAANPASVTEAAKEVLDGLDLIIISSQSTAIDGRVIARTAQDVKVRIDSKSVGDKVSEVFIRVGTLGDKDLSLTILDKMKQELGITSTMDDDKDADEDADKDMDK